MNAGVGSSGVQECLNFSRQIFTRIRPALVILSIGINEADKKPYHADVFHKKYIKLCQTIQLSSDRLVAATTLPVEKNKSLGSLYFDINAIRSINGIIKYTTSYLNIELMDSFAYFSNEQGYMPEDMTIDGCHLTGEAYSKWKQLLNKYIL